jgi:hypothetical protein
VDTLFHTLKRNTIILSLIRLLLVVDTLLIAKHADTFIYVARANFWKKRMLNIANNLYKEQNCQTCVCFLMIQTRLKDMVTAMVMVKP